MTVPSLVAEEPCVWGSLSIFVEWRCCCMAKSSTSHRSESTGEPRQSRSEESCCHVREREGESVKQGQ
jgi:hypothetical protein